jgi:hypothetical protein
VGKSASTGEVVNAILHHLCTDPSLSCYHIGGIDCPTSYQKALKSPQQAEWRASMNEEIDVLWRKRKCWTVVKIPVGVNLLRCHFIFKIKFKNGKVDRLKSRLVVDGSQQHKGINYSDTFAPVVKYTTFRLCNFQT